MRFDSSIKTFAIGGLLAAQLLSGVAMANGPVEWREIIEQPQPEAGLRVRYGDAESQFGELYLPEGGGPFPVVVLIHGGCWRIEYGVDHVAPLADDLRDEGVAVWSLEYRRLGELGGGFPGTFDDTVAGFGHLEQLADAHPLDLDRVALAGHSAGGHLALWLAARQNLPVDHRWRTDLSSGLRGVVALSAISDLARYAEEDGACNQAAAELFGEDESQREDRLVLVSPDRLLPPAAPIHLVHGREDAIVPVNQSVVHAARIRAAGGEARRHIIEEAGHFDLIAPFTDSWSRVRGLILGLLDETAVDAGRRGE